MISKISRQAAQLIIFADDYVPRYITASTMVDYDTVAGGDKVLSIHEGFQIDCI